MYISIFEVGMVLVLHLPMSLSFRSIQVARSLELDSRRRLEKYLGCVYLQNSKIIGQVLRSGD